MTKRNQLASGEALKLGPLLPSTPAGRVAFVCDLLGGEYEYFDEETGETVRGYSPPMITSEEALALLEAPFVDSPQPKHRAPSVKGRKRGRVS